MTIGEYRPKLISISKPWFVNPRLTLCSRSNFLRLSQQGHTPVGHSLEIWEDSDPWKVKRPWTKTVKRQWKMKNLQNQLLCKKKNNNNKKPMCLQFCAQMFWKECSRHYLTQRSLGSDPGFYEKSTRPWDEKHGCHLKIFKGESTCTFLS